MWLIKRVKLNGRDTDRAMREAEAIGLRSRGLKDFAVKYAAADGSSARSTQASF